MISRFAAWTVKKSTTFGFIYFEIMGYRGDSCKLCKLKKSIMIWRKHMGG